MNLVLGDGRSLGLTIRGGAEYGLGIYITGVDPGSEAESSGLKVGDQILEVNGRSFLSILHDEAVKLLKSSRHLILTVKDVREAAPRTYHRGPDQVDRQFPDRGKHHQLSRVSRGPHRRRDKQARILQGPSRLPSDPEQPGESDTCTAG